MEFKKLEELQEKRRNCLLETKSLEDQKQTELEEARQQIESKYASRINENLDAITDYNHQIDETCTLIEEYSSFYIGGFIRMRAIGDIIADLMQVFEGKKYVYIEKKYYTEGEERWLRTIVEDGFQGNYSDLTRLVENGQAIVLENISLTHVNRDISFYRADLEYHCVEECVNFDHFPYVREFLKELISYRIQKKRNGDVSKVLGEEDEVCKNFILARKEAIEAHYKELDEEQEKRMREQLETERNVRKLNLKRIVDSKKKENKPTN